MNRHTWFRKPTRLRECKRRLRQIKAGQLSGRTGRRLAQPYVSELARLTAQRVIL